MGQMTKSIHETLLDSILIVFSEVNYNIVKKIRQRVAYKTTIFFYYIFYNLNIKIIYYYIFFRIIQIY
jgi:hypothetical protein